MARQAALKKTEEKLELLTGIDMLLIVEKGIRGFINMPKPIRNIRRIMIKIKNHHILNIGMYIIYIVEQCRKSFQ